MLLTRSLVRAVGYAIHTDSHALVRGFLPTIICWTRGKVSHAASSSWRFTHLASFIMLPIFRINKRSVDLLGEKVYAALHLCDSFSRKTMNSHYNIFVNEVLNAVINNQILLYCKELFVGKRTNSIRGLRPFLHLPLIQGPLWVKKSTVPIHLCGSETSLSLA